MMAYKAPNSSEDVQKGETTIKVDEVTQDVDGLSLTHINGECSEPPVKEACRARNYEDETSLKSLTPNKGLNTTTSTPGGKDFDRRRPHPTSAVGVQARQIAQKPKMNLAHASTDQDISLDATNAHLPVTQLTMRPSTTADTSTPQDSFYTTSRSISTDGSQIERITDSLQLGMNILPSFQEPWMKNTDIPTALAEQQLSFRTTSTVTSDLLPIKTHSEETLRVQTKEDDGAQFLLSGRQSGFTEYSRQHPMCSIAACASSEDNTYNISMSPLLGHPPMTAQLVSRDSQVWQNNGNNQYRSQAGASGSGRQLSYSSSNSSLKSIINDDCLVKKLYRKILSHVALSLQCRNSSASWKDLVEMYGWDYERTYLFDNKDHNEGIFFSLLREPEFQDYSLEQLRQDLFDLPRKDILNDLNRMISEHNAMANRAGTSQNQLN